MIVKFNFNENIHFHWFIFLATSQSLTRPVPSGYALALSLQNIDTNRLSIPRESRHGPRIRQNRMNISTNLPSQDDLKKIKHDKKVRITFH
jgi:hypothetical protein